MRIVNTISKEAIVSMPRVGTWTLVKFFRSLNPPDPNWVHYNEKDGFLYDIDPANEDAFKNVIAYQDWKIAAVIRDPWERYVSGVCEFIFGGSSTGLFPARALDDKDLQRVKLSQEKNNNIVPIFHISDEMRSDYKFIRGTLENMYMFCNYDISLAENMHTRNWLQCLITASKHSTNFEVIILENLEKYLSKQWPLSHFKVYNKTVLDFKNTVERALTDMMMHDKIFRNRVQEYLDPEIARYKNLLVFAK